MFRQMNERMNKTDEETVALLEERVARGDTYAMTTLARLCALGHGTEQNIERAYQLLSDAAKKRSHYANNLIDFINKCIRERRIALGSLRNLFDDDV